jgi:hypothetical protein
MSPSKTTSGLAHHPGVDLRLDGDIDILGSAGARESATVATVASMNFFIVALLFEPLGASSEGHGPAFLVDAQ